MTRSLIQIIIMSRRTIYTSLYIYAQDQCAIKEKKKIPACYIHLIEGHTEHNRSTSGNSQRLTAI